MLIRVQCLGLIFDCFIFRGEELEHLEEEKIFTTIKLLTPTRLTVGPPSHNVFLSNSSERSIHPMCI
jgi:hypothetical protein